MSIGEENERFTDVDGYVAPASWYLHDLAEALACLKRATTHAHSEIPAKMRDHAERCNLKGDYDRQWQAEAPEVVRFQRCLEVYESARRLFDDLRTEGKPVNLRLAKVRQH